MNFKSNLKEVLEAFNKGKKETCEEIGNFITAEAVTRVVKLTGNLSRSISYEVMENGDGVDLGTTADAKYGVVVEKGIGQTAQPFMEPSAMENIDKLEEIAGQKFTVNMGGK